MKERIIVVAHKHKETLGTVRCMPELRVAQQGEQLWVRGIAADEKVPLAIRQLPALQSYLLDDRNYLFLAGGFTPVGKLADVVWTPISQFIRPELPTSALPGKGTQSYRVQLVPSQQVAAGAALVTDLSLWKEYANLAPEARLAPLRFAFSERNQILILGTPLPSIPGKEYWRHNSLLLPAGYHFEISMVAGLLESKLNPSADALIVFDTEGYWEKIQLTDFAAATRSAVRLTEGRRRHE